MGSCPNQKCIKTVCLSDTWQCQRTQQREAVIIARRPPALKQKENPKDSRGTSAKMRNAADAAFEHVKGKASSSKTAAIIQAAPNRSASSAILVAFAESLRDLSKDENSHQSMIDSGSIAPLLGLVRPLRSTSSDAEHAALQAVCFLSRSEVGRAVIEEGGGIQKLCACIDVVGSMTSPYVARALANMAHHGGAAFRMAIVEAGAVPGLIALLRSPKHQNMTKHPVALTLRYLTYDQQTCAAVREAGGFQDLADFVQHAPPGSKDAAREAAHALEVRPTCKLTASHNLSTTVPTYYLPPASLRFSLQALVNQWEEAEDEEDGKIDEENENRFWSEVI